MKKILVILLLFVTIVTSAQAKRDYDSWDILVGAKVGATYSGLTSLNGDYRFGPYGGMYVEVFFFKNFSMDVEITSTHNGMKNVMHDVGESNASAGPYEYRLDYINAAYLFKLYPMKRLNLGVYAGVQMSYLANAKSELDGQSLSIKRRLHKGDCAIPVGLEYSFGNFTIDARYNFGLIKIAKGESAKRILGDARNSNATLTLGYRFQLF